MKPPAGKVKVLTRTSAGEPMAVLVKGMVYLLAPNGEAFGRPEPFESWLKRKRP